MTVNKIVSPDNLEQAMRLVKDYIGGNLTGDSSSGDGEHDKDGNCNVTPIDSTTINQILTQTGFPTIT